ncbi:MAG: protein-disulfide reductase DsbD [Acidiferrobacter sp.]
MALRPIWRGWPTPITASLILAALLMAGMPAAAVASTTASGPVAAFKAFFSHREAHKFLRRSQAFQLTLTPQGHRALRAQFHIAKGYYLYQNKIHFTIITPRHGVTLGPVAMPPASTEHNRYLGTLVIYKRSFTLPIPITGAAPGQTLTIAAHYQGCAVRGICYPPATHVVTLTLPASTGAAHRAPLPSARPATPPPVPPAPPLTLATWVSAIVGAFGVGLLLTFTPCVLPMIPILSSMLVREGGRRLTKTQGGLLSLAYVLGTGVTYAAAGALAGATGGQLQAYFENAWGIGILSLLFVLMALSLFDVYALQMPAFIQSRLHNRTHTLHGGSLAGAFVLGLLSALVVGACVTPLLLSALGLAISAHSAALGAAIMFSIALGMGVVLIALGVGAGFLLPKAGPWMDGVKYTFGVLLLAVAIYLLGFLPQVPVLLLWGALFVIVGVYLGAGRVPAGASGYAKLRAGVGALLLIWGVLSIVGGAAGGRDVLHPLPPQPIDHPARGAPTLAHWHHIASLTALNTQLAQAQARHQPVLVDFSASWCVDCLRLQRETFPAPAVQRAFRGMRLIAADVSDNTAATRALKRRFGILGPPALLFFNAEGQPLRQDDFYGYLGPQPFAALLQRVQHS